MDSLEPLHNVLGVATMAACLAPGEPLGKGFHLPAGRQIRCVRLICPTGVHHGAHVHQTERTARQRFAAARTRREPICARACATWTRLIQQSIRYGLATEIARQINGTRAAR